MQHLVVGGTGFIGGRLVEHLSGGGGQVRALARRAERPAWFPPGADLVQGDLSQPEALPALARGADVVYCATRLPSPSGGEEEALAELRHSLTGLVRACARARVARLVLVSGIDVYDPAMPERPITEDFPTTPRAATGRLRLAAERIAREAAATEGLSLAIVRPVTVIGPRDYAFTCPLLDMYRCAPGPALVGGGRARLSLVYVGDVARALALVAQHPRADGRVFHVSGVATTWRALIATVCAALETPMPPPGLPHSLSSALRWCLTHVAPPRSDVSFSQQLALYAGRTRLFSDERLVRETGYLPVYDLLTAVDETVAWYRGMTRLAAPRERAADQLAATSHGA